MEQEVFPKFEETLPEINEEITDQIFSFIENDKDLFHEYQYLLSEKLKNFHSSIAKMIANRYGLENKHVKVKPTKSKLIQSYSQLKKK